MSMSDYVLREIRQSLDRPTRQEVFARLAELPPIQLAPRLPTSCETTGTSGEIDVIVVLDASAVVELVLVTAPGVRIRRRLSEPRISMHGPELVDLKVLNVLRT